MKERGDWPAMLGKRADELQMRLIAVIVHGFVIKMERQMEKGRLHCGLVLPRERQHSEADDAPCFAGRQEPAQFGLVQDLEIAMSEESYIIESLFQTLRRLVADMDDEFLHSCHPGPVVGDPNPSIGKWFMWTTDPIELHIGHQGKTIVGTCVLPGPPTDKKSQSCHRDREQTHGYFPTICGRLIHARPPQMLVKRHHTGSWAWGKRAR